ncbi:MAG: flagellar hook-length control protein FliK [Bacilli bacterium]
MINGLFNLGASQGTIQQRTYGLPSVGENTQTLDFATLIQNITAPSEPGTNAENTETKAEELLEELMTKLEQLLQDFQRTQKEEVETQQTPEMMLAMFMQFLQQRNNLAVDGVTTNEGLKVQTAPPEQSDAEVNELLLKLATMLQENAQNQGKQLTVKDFAESIKQLLQKDIAQLQQLVKWVDSESETMKQGSDLLEEFMATGKKGSEGLSKVESETAPKVELVSKAELSVAKDTTQYALAVPKTKTDGVDTKNFVNQLERILQQAQFSQTTGVKRMMIRLHPEHLGSIRIELMQTEDGIRTRILTSSTKVKEMVESNIVQLQNALQQSHDSNRVVVSESIRHFEQQKEQQQKQQQQQQENEIVVEEQSFQEFMSSLIS